MSKKDQRKTISSNNNFIDDIVLQIKLILRLLADSRINPFLKLIPFGSIAYLLIPDLVIGPLDDAAVIWLGFYLFIELCPQEVVEEHRAALQKVIPGEWKEPQDDESVVDGEFKDVL